MVGVVPDLADHAGEDFGAPLLAGDDDGLAVLIEGSDAVIRWVGGGGWGGECGYFFWHLFLNLWGCFMGSA